MAIAGFILSFLGILLAFTSILMAYVAFFAPSITAQYIIKDRGKWIEINSHKEGCKFLRHRLMSGFSIEIDFANPVAEDFFEPWLDALYRPDKHASSYYVVVFFNGLPIMSELFISFDGSRNFIPAPKIERVNSRYYLYFNSIQRSLAHIVGRVHIYDSIDQAMEKIIKSRFNPILSSLDEIKEDLSLAELSRKIEKFKHNSSYFNT